MADDTYTTESESKSDNHAYRIPPKNAKRNPGKSLTKPTASPILLSPHSMAKILAFSLTTRSSSRSTKLRHDTHDLVNQSRDKVMTHWYMRLSHAPRRFVHPFTTYIPSLVSLHLLDEPRQFASSLTAASVPPLVIPHPTLTHTHAGQPSRHPSPVPNQRTYPQLITNVDPTEFTRLRFVIAVQMEEGILHRVRLLQWKDLALIS
jgi:hypothetical protein